MGSVKAGLHMSPYRYNSEEEVMSSGPAGSNMCCVKNIEQKLEGGAKASHLAAPTAFLSTVRRPAEFHKFS